MSDRDGNSFVWFLAGLGLGALAGVLYAPRSGSETREVLRARAEEGRDYVRNRAREAREQAAQWADKGRDVVNRRRSSSALPTKRVVRLITKPRLRRARQEFVSTAAPASLSSRRSMELPEARLWTS